RARPRLPCLSGAEGEYPRLRRSRRRDVRRPRPPARLQGKSALRDPIRIDAEPLPERRDLVRAVRRADLARGPHLHLHLQRAIGQRGNLCMHILTGFADISLAQIGMVAAMALLASLVGGVAGYGTGVLMPLVLVPIAGAEAVVPIIAISSMFTN